MRGDPKATQCERARTDDVRSGVGSDPKVPKNDGDASLSYPLRRGFVFLRVPKAVSKWATRRTFYRRSLLTS